MFGKLRCLLAAVLLVFGTGSMASAAITRTFECVVIDGVRIPFGTSVEITGRNQSDLDRIRVSYASACLEGRRIDGRAIDGAIDFLLCATGERSAPRATTFLSYNRTLFIERGVVWSMPFVTVPATASHCS